MNVGSYNVPLPLFLVKAAGYLAGSLAVELWRQPFALVAVVAVVLLCYALVAGLLALLRQAAVPVAVVVGVVYVAGHVLGR